MRNINYLAVVWDIITNLTLSTKLLSGQQSIHWWIYHLKKNLIRKGIMHLYLALNIFLWNCTWFFEIMMSLNQEEVWLVTNIYICIYKIFSLSVIGWVFLHFAHHCNKYRTHSWMLWWNIFPFLYLKSLVEQPRPLAVQTKHLVWSTLLSVLHIGYQPK